jgi:4-amino-4-deoxy-L-arabinose transferase-like glycosyltransferase
MTERFFWPLVLLLLAVLGTVQALSVRQESQTWDEGFELASGYSYLKTGEYRISLEHPPLARVIAALPLLWLDPRVPVEHPSWEQRKIYEFGLEFLHFNRVDADTLLQAARLPMILLTLGLGLAMALWTRRKLGAAAALFALLLFAFDPNVIANGRYVKNDVAVTLFAFLSCAAWGGFLENRRKFRLVLAAVSFGLALATKFSAVFLVPVFVLLGLLAWWRRREEFPVRRLALWLAVVMGVAGLVVVAVYAPYARSLAPVSHAARLKNPAIRMLEDTVIPYTKTGETLAWLGRRLGLQSHPFLEGIAVFAYHNAAGHQAYLLGMRSEHGWWYYFPVAFLVKTPVATLLALAIGLILAVRLAFAAPLKALPGRLRAARFCWFVLVVPILVYVPLAMASTINCGVRHLLPIYPFLFVLLGAGLVSLSRYGLVVRGLIVGLLIVESAAIYPHYLAFFNAAAGGPGNGPRYLLDSNLDWGQDAKKLKTYVTEHNIARVCTCYFGSARLGSYGIFPVDDVPDTKDLKWRERVDCVAAVSATTLYGLYNPVERFAWLRERKPMAKIGYSIYLYDLRKTHR